MVRGGGFIVLLLALGLDGQLRRVLLMSKVGQRSEPFTIKIEYSATWNLGRLRVVLTE